MKKIIYFILSVSSIALAMEEQQHPIKKKGIPSLTYLAADAYIKSMKKDGESNQEISNAIKQELDEKCPLITTEVQDIINNRLSKDNVYLQQELYQEVVAVLPELGQVVTKEGNYDGISINFWARHKHDNKDAYNLLTKMKHSVGIAAGLTNVAQTIAAQSIMGDGQWYKVSSLQLPENFELDFITNTTLGCLVKTYNEDTDLEIINSLALFVREGNNWELKKIFEMEQSIDTCAYSEQDDTLACILEDKTIMFWRYDKKHDQWKKCERIACEKKIKKQKKMNEHEKIGNSLLATHDLENIFFLQQSYREHPLCILYHSLVQEDGHIDEEILSLWRFDGKKWIFVEVLLKAESFDALLDDGKSLVVHYDDEQGNQKTLVLRECKTQESPIVKEEFDRHRFFSADGSLYAVKDESSDDGIKIELFDATGENLLRTITLTNCCAGTVFFLDYKTIIWYDGKTLFLSLDCSTNFALCKQALQEAQEQENPDFEVLLNSSMFAQLTFNEKEHILHIISKIKIEKKPKVFLFRHVRVERSQQLPCQRKTNLYKYIAPAFCTGYLMSQCYLSYIYFTDREKFFAIVNSPQLLVRTFLENVHASAHTLWNFFKR